MKQRKAKPLTISVSPASLRGALFWSAIITVVIAVAVGRRPQADTLLTPVEQPMGQVISRTVAVANNGTVVMDGVNISETVRRTLTADELRLVVVREPLEPVSIFNLIVMLPVGLTDSRDLTVLAVHGGTVEPPVFNARRNRAAVTVREVEVGATVSLVVTMPRGALALGPRARLASLTSAVPEYRWWLLGSLIPLLTYMGFYGWACWRRYSPVSSGLVDQPPSSISPAAAALLVSGRRSPTLLAATLVNMAVRGDIQLVQTGAGYRLARRRTLTNLSRLEELLVAELRLSLSPVSHEDQIREEAHRHLFNKQMTEAYEAVYHELESRGFFADTRRTTVIVRSVSFGLILAAVVLALLAGWLVPDGWLLSPLFAGCFLAGWVVLVVAPQLPALTHIGQTERSRWLAFRDYLTSPLRQSDPQSVSLFEQFLPYAVGFGVHDAWLARFPAEFLALPEWYFNEENPGSSEVFLAEIHNLVDDVGRTLSLAALPHN